MQEESLQPCIGYLVNQYPKISHTFVRTEIEGHEMLGAVVHRYSIRPSPDRLVDVEDKAEESRTRVILQAKWDLATGIFRAAVHPVKFFRGLALAVRTGFRSERGILRHFIYFAEACVLRKWTSDAQVQHLHVHFGTNSTVVAMLCHELGGPGYSFTAHGPEEFDKATQIALPLKIQRARFVVGVSNFGRAQLWRYTAAQDWNRIHIVRCGADQRFLQQECTPVPDVRRLVSVGRLSEKKGQLILVRAAAELKKRTDDFEIVLIGDGELRSMLESAIAELELEQNIRLVGWRSPEEIREHILDCRALVLPSFAEGLPVVIMEALALRRPVISTYVAGIPELVVPDETGWLVPAGAVDPLVATMEEVLNCDPGKLSEMGATGFNWVSERHDARKNAQQLNRLIAGALADERD
jgi:glycosyltransferase involved in cell wall biosynthesis